jgi:hypothetical protein
VFTIDTDEHFPPGPAPIPEELTPPSAKREPPLNDLIVTFDSDEHSRPAYFNVGGDRNSFDPVTSRTTELSEMSSGGEALELRLMSESTIIACDRRISIVASVEFPKIVHESKRM